MSDSNENEIVVARQYPRVYIFPRAKDTLFEYRRDVRGHRMRDIWFKDLFPMYSHYSHASIPNIKSSDPNKKAGTLKEIEYRMYVDLWKRENESDSPKTSRKMTLCFVKEASDGTCKTFEFSEEEPDFYGDIDDVQVILTIDKKNIQKTIQIEGEVNGYSFTNVNKNEKAYVPLSVMKRNGFMCEFTVTLVDSTNSVPEKENGTFEICAQLIRRKINKSKTGAVTGEEEEKIGGEMRVPITIYRADAPQNAEKPFEYYWKNGEGKDHDFFVLPRVNQEEIHEAYIKRIKVFNNQVFARNQGFSTSSFSFLKEDASVPSVLCNQMRNSIAIFRNTQTETPRNYLSTSFKYSFAGFGQSKDLAESLAKEYDISIETVQGIVLDRNFLYGNTNTPANISAVEGLENLYTHVVEVFRQNMITEAMKYVNFNQRWLGRPKEYKRYQRGTFIIPANANLYLYSTNNPINGNNNTNTLAQINGNPQTAPLQALTEVTFFEGNDEFDRRIVTGDIETTHLYRVASIKQPGQRRVDFGVGNTPVYIPLTYAHKQLCSDNQHAQNYSTYASTQGLTDLGDTVAIQQYVSQNGVPYYKSNNNNYGGKDILTDITPRLSMCPSNWYSYPDNPRSKPNGASGLANNQNVLGVGLDCSGLVMNCLLDIKTNLSQENFFIGLNVTPSTSKRSFGESANDMGRDRARPIRYSAGEEDGAGLELAQSGDVLYSSDHIALCAIEQNAHLSQSDYQGRYFPIIHNYGEAHIFVNNILPAYREQGEKENAFFGGFFQKTLRGPFRHWGVQLIRTTSGVPNAFAGRIYLWYNN